MQSLSPCIIEGTVEGGVAVNKEPQGAPRRLSGWQPNAEVLRGGQGSSCRKTQEKGLPLGRWNLQGVEKDRVHR